MKKFENYSSALDNLKKAYDKDLTDDFIQSGIINKFSLQFELSWKLLKFLLEYEGDSVSATGSPRAIIKSAFRFYGFIDEDAWLAMLSDRNMITHIYDSEHALKLISRILECYIPAFEELKQGLLSQYGDTLYEPDDHFA